MPERTCVCCRKKSEKENLIRLSEIENKIVDFIFVKIVVV